MDTQQAIALCREFQTKLSPEWFVALTGSALYGAAGGGGTGKDVDVIIYPYVDPESGDYSQTPHKEIIQTLRRIGPGNIHYQLRFSSMLVHLCSHSIHGRVDIFFMIGNIYDVESESRIEAIDPDPLGLAL